MIIRSFAQLAGRCFPGARVASARWWTRSYAKATSDLDDANRTTSQFGRNGIGSPAQGASATGANTDLPALSNVLDAETVETLRKYQTIKHQNKTLGTYGAAVANRYRPHKLLLNPPKASDLTPELLLASQSHLGHSTSLWNPINSRYIFGARDGIHIIALEETLAHLRRACRVVEGVAERGGVILFVGTRKQQDQSVVMAARLAGGYHLFEKWIPGSITNGSQILGPCRKILVDMHDTEIAVSEDSLKLMPAVRPDLVVCLNPLENWVLLNECALNSIPTVAVIDTDADPTCVTYPIPANDDSNRCIDLIAGTLGRAGQAGQVTRRRLAEEGRILYDPITLPPNVVLGEKYMTELDTEGAPEGWIGADGQALSQEQVANMEREGMIIDDSMMRWYNDNDGGDPHATQIHRFDEETDDLMTEVTVAGGISDGFSPIKQLNINNDADDHIKNIAFGMTGGDEVIERGDFEITDVSTSTLSDVVSELSATFESIQMETSKLHTEANAVRLTDFESRTVSLAQEIYGLTSTLPYQADFSNTNDSSAQAGYLTKLDLDTATDPGAFDTQETERIEDELIRKSEADLASAAKPEADSPRKNKAKGELKGRPH